MTTAKILGLNGVQLYLIFINILSFLGFQRSWSKRDRELEAESDEKVRIILDFETWVLDFVVFLGGGIGMLLSLVIHLKFPSGYNANWWAFCYASILFWTTIYCYLCNPLGHMISVISWFSIKHISFYVYLILINILSGLLFYSFRKKQIDEYSIKYTFLLLMGAIGGTIGGFISVIATRHVTKFNYAVLGFPIMLIGQVVFSMYMMSIGIF